MYQYDAGQALAMRPYRPPTEAQQLALRAGRACIGTALCASCQARVERYKLDGGSRCPRCAAQAARIEELADWRAACAYAAHILSLDPLFVEGRPGFV